MTEEEFIEKVNAVIVGVYNWSADKHRFIFADKMAKDWKYSYLNKKAAIGDTLLTWKWATGGMSGGSCWGDEPKYYSSSDEEPSITPLDSVLEKLVPNISLFVYKRICSDLIITVEESDYEYYGNRTNYIKKVISANSLYKALKEADQI